MLEALEGSMAIAKAVTRCRPEVVAAYPITPQTHIVENISKLVADGQLKTELVSVESEFSAASVVLGAAAAGARAYTASSSQGILLMAEVLFNISGMRIPMVLTCANRAIGAPINIWNDQSDSMAVRDSGWIQIYCADNQEAVDSTIQAYRITERTELPVMVCMDGFVLTHTYEPVDIPDQDLVDSYLPPFEFKRALDPMNPKSLGTMVGPDFFPEIRHSHHQAMVRSMSEIEAADADWQNLTGRQCGGLLSVDGPEDADLGILCIGSAINTLHAAREEHPELRPAKLIKLRCYRPFPAAALCEACRGLKDLVVVERAFSPGLGGIIGTEVRAALAAGDGPMPRIVNYTIGLGGRDIPIELYPQLIESLDSAHDGAFKIFDVELEKLAEEDR
ncbi:MAG: pyruvate ferredoxin oxidoreductase [Rhodospirillaceae bacterium]|nr:pyruvate ferredoxin oxidoreductase [Rhodospirillaceae bacterium]